MMETNWKGIFRGMLGSDWDFLPNTLQLIDKPKGNNDNNGVPFCLTKEFAEFGMCISDSIVIVAARA